MADVSVPPIVAGRFGLEQRITYRHHDLYDEEVPEVDLETAVARPDLGSGCAVRTFLLLGDQNAGKSTMLHSFCREGDPSFMQMSSLLPVLSSSFINTRLVPRSLLGAGVDLNQHLSDIRDEMPFMDTDIARGLVMLSLENFAFFCNEFGIEGYGADPAAVEATGRPGGFAEDVRFVALQFIELGGDHLDRLLRFAASGGDLAAVRAAERRGASAAAVAAAGAAAAGAVDEEAKEEEAAFWADMHEVLLGSMRLLKDTTRTVYFVNCATLFPGGRLSAPALRATLRKLRFLDGALGSGAAAAPAVAGAGGSTEILFYCSRAPAVDAASFDASAAWAAARAEVLAFAREELGHATAAGLQKLLPGAAPPTISTWEVDDEGLDLSALQEVAGDEAREWREAEERAGPLLAFIRDLLVGLVLPALRSRLRLMGVYAVRNLADAAEGDDAPFGKLCVSSIVRNVARLLQRRVCHVPQQGGDDTSLVPHVAELILRCAASVRSVEAPRAQDASATLHGRWVTRSDLADHLEELEAQHAAVPLPEVATLQGWGAAAAALVAAGVCVQLAPGDSGLPDFALELAPGGASVAVRVAPARVTAAAPAPEQEGLVVVTSLTASTRPRPTGPEAVGLPLDAEFFALLTSEAAVQGIASHLASQASSSSPSRFRFASPGATAQLQAVHRRLHKELTEMASELATHAAGGGGSSPSGGPRDGLLHRLLHVACDVWQAQVLLGAAASDGAASSEPAAKRVRPSGEARAAAERLAECLQGLAARGDPGVAAALSERSVSEEEDEARAIGLVPDTGPPLLRLRLAL